MNWLKLTLMEPGRGRARANSALLGAYWSTALDSRCEERAMNIGPATLSHTSVLSRRARGAMRSSSQTLTRALRVKGREGARPCLQEQAATYVLVQGKLRPKEQRDKAGARVSGGRLYMLKEGPH